LACDAFQDLLQSELSKIFAEKQELAIGYWLLAIRVSVLQPIKELIDGLGIRG
jgi:hypothetical protein